MSFKELIPFKQKKIKTSAQLVAKLKDLATETYGNPFAELARIKVELQQLVKELNHTKTKGGK